jgi:acyl-CoA thioesterase I
VRRLAALRGAVAAIAVLVPLAAHAAEPGWCNAPPGWTAIQAPLERTAERINEGAPLNIIAVGSSSTVGVGATSPAEAYPNLLQAALREHFPSLAINVANRGVSGEDAPEELARLTADVIVPHPDLAIWQVGTNAVLRRDDLSADGELMREGVNRLKKAGIDVVLMDLQYAPRVLDRPSYGVMEDLISDTASDAHVGLFRRFALMRYWERTHPPDAPAMIGDDGVHMTDAGYGCLASDLAGALEANWRSGEKLARRPHGSTDTIAGLPAAPSGKADSTTQLPGVRRNDAKPLN